MATFTKKPTKKTSTKKTSKNATPKKPGRPSIINKNITHNHIHAASAQPPVPPTPPTPPSTSVGNLIPPLPCTCQPSHHKPGQRCTCGWPKPQFVGSKLTRIYQECQKQVVVPSALYMLRRRDIWRCWMEANLPNDLTQASWIRDYGTGPDVELWMRIPANAAPIDFVHQREALNTYIRIMGFIIGVPSSTWSKWERSGKKTNQEWFKICDLKNGNATPPTRAPKPAKAPDPQEPAPDKPAKKAKKGKNPACDCDACNTPK